MDATLALVDGYMIEPRLHQIATVNPEFVMAAQTDADFRRVLAEADLCLPDGVGLLYAARRYGRRLPERVPGSELVYRLAERAAARGWSLFLLGAAPGVAEEAATILGDQYPGLHVVGTYAGSPDPAENEAGSGASTTAARRCCSWPMARRSRTSGSPATATPCRRCAWLSVSAAHSTSSPAGPCAPHSGCNGWAWSGCTGSSASRGAGEG